QLSHRDSDLRPPHPPIGRSGKLLKPRKTQGAVRAHRPAKRPEPWKREMRSRPPLDRMMRIHQSLQSRALPNATTLARELEVGTKTIHRDLEFMRDRLNLPIVYDGARHGYHY